jgi:VanZ family protein
LERYKVVSHMESTIMKTMRWVWWLLVIIWCAVIFYQSSKPAPESQRQSMAIVAAINRLASTIIGSEVVIVTDTMVRKTAHFIEYGILGFLLFNALNAPRRRRVLLLAIVFGILYAASDELHQFFVPGRSMRLIDLGVDAAGVICGAGFVFWVLRINARSSSRLTPGPSPRVDRLP